MGDCMNACAAHLFFITRTTGLQGEELLLSILLPALNQTNAIIGAGLSPWIKDRAVALARQ